MSMPASELARPLFVGGMSLAAAMWAAAPAVAQDARNCSVEAVSGTGLVTGPGGERQAIAGLALNTDDIVHTDANSQVNIVCNDGITITVGFASRIDLRSLVNDEPEETGILLRLIDGIAAFIVPQKTFPSFAVETQTAVAAVRSTEWLVDAHEGATDVFVRKGRVGVDPTGGAEVLLAAGEGVDVNADGQAADVKQWGAMRIAAAGVRLGFAWQ